MAKEKFNSRERSISTDSGSVEAMTNLPRLKEVLWWKPVEITWKMDGGNTTLCADGTAHARSIDSKKHLSREELTSLWNSK